jgi:hypothetical protein
VSEEHTGFRNPLILQPVEVYVCQFCRTARTFEPVYLIRDHHRLSGTLYHYNNSFTLFEQDYVYDGVLVDIVATIHRWLSDDVHSASPRWNLNQHGGPWEYMVEVTSAEVAQAQVPAGFVLIEGVEVTKGPFEVTRKHLLT